MSILKPGFRRRPLIEELEPRLLFSADLAPVSPNVFQPDAEQRTLDPSGEFSPTRAQSLRHELVLVDTRIEDYQILLNDIFKQAGDNRHIEIIVLDAARDGLEQISELLQQRNSLDALHIISHGDAGQLQLGNTRLDEAALASRASQFEAWANAFSSEADILLYGCDVAEGDAGQRFVHAFSRLTGADVAASTDKTGSAALGGNWVLETQTGAVESMLLFGPLQTIWQGTLNIQPASTETLANTTTANNQDTTPSSRQIAMHSDGSFVVVWTSGNQDGSGLGVYGQRFDAAGAKQGSEFRINTTTNLDQKAPVIAMDANGNFVVVWQSKSQEAGGGTSWGIFAQRFDASGVKLGAEFRVNTTVSNDQTSPSVGMDANGNFVVAWQSLNQDGDGWGIYAQRFNAGGSRAGAEFRVNSTTTNNQHQPAVAMNASGAFVIVWTSEDQDTDLLGNRNDGVYARLFDKNGNTVKNPFSVYPWGLFDFTNQHSPDVAMNDDGKFVVVLTDEARGNPNIDAFMFDAAGNRQNLGVEVNDTSQAYASDIQQNPSVAIDNSGDFIVAWESKEQDGDAFGIVARHFRADYSAYEAEQVINPHTIGYQSSPSLVWKGAKAVFVWSGNGVADSQGVYFRQATITSNNTPPVITSNGGGNNASVSIPENTSAVTTVTATDAQSQPVTYSISGGADAGRFTIDAASGVLRFIAAPDFDAPADANADNIYEVVVQAADSAGGTDNQTLQVAVTNVNEAPIAQNDAYSLSQDSTLSVPAPSGVLANDSDPDKTPLSASLIASPSNGSLTLNPDGSFTYTPNAGWVGTDSFTYEARDGSLGSGAATVLLNVNPVNDAPVITSNGGGNSASAGVAENTLHVTTVTATDIDLPAQMLTFSLAGGADQSKFSIDPVTGVLRFISAPDFENPADDDFNNVYEVNVRVSDGSLTDTQSLYVAVTDVGGPLVVTTTNDVLDGNTSSVEALIANPGADGKISLREAISAANNTAGHDSITLPAGWYTLSLPGANENANTGGDLDINGNLTLTGAGAGTTTISGNGLFRVIDILGGSVRMEGLTIRDGISNTEGGGIFIRAGANLDLFQVTVINNTAGSAGGGVLVQAGASLALNQSAVAFNHADYGAGIYAYGALSAIDSTIDANQASKWGGGVFSDKGIVALERVTVSNNRAGMDGGGLYNFGNGSTMSLANVTVSGNIASGLGGALFSNQTATILNSTIAYNSAGTAGGIYLQNPGSVTLQGSIVAWNVNENSNKTLTSLGSNLESGNTLGLNQTGDQASTNPMLGALQNNGGYTFTHALLPGSPAVNTGGPSATLTDQRGQPRDAMPDIGAYEYTPAGAPMAVDDDLSGSEDTPLAGNVLGNDSDPQSDPLTAIFLSGPANGTLSLDANGNFVYTPSPDWSGTDSFVYRVSDGANFSNAATVTITIAPVNDAPTSSSTNFSTPEDTDHSGTLPAALDADGDAVTYGLASPASHGSVTVNADGSFTYTPTANYHGGDSFSFTVSDGNGGSNTYAVSVSVTPVNDTPVANGIANVGVNEDAANTVIDLFAAFADDEEAVHALNYAVTANTNPALFSAVVIDSVAGILTLGYAPDAFGSSTITVRATDSGGLSTETTFMVTVNAVNDAPSLATSAISVTQGKTIVLDGSVLSAVDTDNTPGELTYVVTAAPAKGTLTLNGAALGTGGTFTQADVDAGRIHYTHTANTTSPDNLGIKLVDAAGSAITGTLVLNVLPAPPSPTGAIPMPEPLSGPAPAQPGVDDATIAGTGADEAAAPSPEPVSVLITPDGKDDEKRDGFVRNDNAAENLNDADRKAGMLNPVQIAFNTALLQNEAPIATPLLVTLNRALDAIASDARALESLKTSLGNDRFQQQLNQLQEEIRQRLNLDRNTVASTLAVSTGLSVGYVLWLVRGGILISSLLSSLPAWRLIDPLPILGHLNRQKQGDGEDESLEGMLKKSAKQSKTPAKDPHAP